MFWLAPGDPRADSVTAASVDFTRPAYEAFQAQASSASSSSRPWAAGPSGRDAGHVTASLAMEDLIAGTGVSYRALIMPSFMDNLLNQVEAIKTQGKFFSPIPADRKIPMVATRDIAAVAAALLLDDSWSGQQDVPVLGAEDLSNNDMAQIISEVLAKPDNLQQSPGAAYGQVYRSDVRRHGRSNARHGNLQGQQPRQRRNPHGKIRPPTTFRQYARNPQTGRPGLDATATANP